jgi:hypothetical protein
MTQEKPESASWCVLCYVRIHRFDRQTKLGRDKSADEFDRIYTDFNQIFLNFYRILKIQTSLIPPNFNEFNCIPPGFLNIWPHAPLGHHPPPDPLVSGSVWSVTYKSRATDVTLP